MLKSKPFCAFWGLSLLAVLAVPAAATPKLQLPDNMPRMTLPAPPKDAVAGTAAGDDVLVSSTLSDPLEPVNRLIFGFNEGVDFLILRPVNFVYRTVLPRPVRKGVSNVVYNLASPVVLANDVLQGEFKRAGTTTSRFLINTTVGIGGIIDVAGKNGLPRHSEDFGQTLARWGIGSGPYIVLPLVGPSTLRDAIAIPVDSAIDPVTWALANESTGVRMAPLGTSIIVYHDEFKDDADNLRKNSADFYASVRDIYSQRRLSEIANGDLMLEPLPPISGE